MPDKVISNGPGRIQPRWKKGQSGNPKGRPKKEHTLTTMLSKTVDEKVTAKIRAMVAKVLPDLPEETTWAQILAYRLLIKGAIEGDMDAIKEIFNRCDGKVKDSVEMSGSNGGPVRIKVVYQTVNGNGV